MGTIAAIIAVERALWTIIAIVPTPLLTTTVVPLRTLVAVIPIEGALRTIVAITITSRGTT